MGLLIEYECPTSCDACAAMYDAADWPGCPRCRVAELEATVADLRKGFGAVVVDRVLYCAGEVRMLLERVGELEETARSVLVQYGSGAPHMGALHRALLGSRASDSVGHDTEQEKKTCP